MTVQTMETAVFYSARRILVKLSYLTLLRIGNDCWLLAWAQVLNSLAGYLSWRTKSCRSNKVERLFQTRRKV
jgi:hypothetical protein